MPGASRIYVLAGVNGAGKSSIGGEIFRASGGDYFNPDEVARELAAQRPELALAEANAEAWQIGRGQLERAIREHLDYAFETTLGGNTIQRLLAEAARKGIEIFVWYVGLTTPELHIDRVAARVRRGGHPIPEEKIRERYVRSRLNLIRLLPLLTQLRMYDNSADAEPDAGRAPALKLVLHWKAGSILGPKDLAPTPEWAKPIVAAALECASVKKG